MKGIVPINFMVMANTVKSTSKIKPKCYDLKGSTVNRIVTKGENQTLKDLNLLNIKKFRKNKNGLLQFKRDDIKTLNEIISVDMEFLRDLNLLDYSVLLGIETIENTDTPLPRGSSD